MTVLVVCVGRPGALLSPAIAEYERRASRYWKLEVVEVREQKAGQRHNVTELRRIESERLLERVTPGLEVVALTRGGQAWDSAGLASHLAELAVRGHAGLAFLIGGAAGIDEAVLRGADRKLALSSLTLPHDLARLVLAEQLYRSGTILRGEPYHRGPI
jgi:23S rRNA (pseudouridine1915-N3)-methyltransferase